MLFFNQSPLELAHLDCFVRSKFRNLSQFRRIEFIYMRLFLPNPPSDVVIMENLQILKIVQNFKFSEEAVERIPNMKKLALRYSMHEDYYCHCNIQRLHKLESLDVSLLFFLRPTALRSFPSLNLTGKYIRTPSVLYFLAKKIVTRVLIKC